MTTGAITRGPLGYSVRCYDCDRLIGLTTDLVTAVAIRNQHRMTEHWV